MSPRPSVRTALLAIACIAVAVAPASVRAADAEPVTVSATPITSVRDGDVVSLNVKTTGDQSAAGAEARLCRPGVAYQTSTNRQPADDARLGGANCPPTPISSSADVTVTAPTTLATNAATADGETFSLHVGAGTVDWTSGDGTTEYALTCDEDNPCALVVELRAGPSGGPLTWTPYVFDVTYRTSDPISGCGGPADGIVSSAGSDRTFDLWVDLTLAICDGASTGAPTRASFTGEADAVESFAEGLTDLAYTGLGYGSGTELVDGIAADADKRQRAVMVPIAMNAAVIAVGNGRLDPAKGRKVAYSDVKLTLDEVATLLGGGHYAMDPYLDAIYERNPELKETGFFNTNSEFKVGGPATGDTGTWLTTSALAALRPAAWKVPDQDTFRAEAGKPRHASASLATADPSFQTALSLFSGRPVLARSLNALGASDYGGVYVLTDLATARAFGLTPVEIENANGEFVAPTPESIAAARPHMRQTQDGTLVPDPTAAVGKGTQPYPLAFVEYAMVPAEPLRAAAPDCAPRTESQARLNEWLRYVTGPGQAKLPRGFVALPDDLRAQAAAALGDVGASPTTGACAALAASDQTGTLKLEALPSADVPGGDAPETTPTTPRRNRPDAPVSALAPLVSNPVTRAAAAAIRPLAALLNPRRIGQLWPTIALFGVLGLTTVAVRLTSRRSLW